MSLQKGGSICWKFLAAVVKIQAVENFSLILGFFCLVIFDNFLYFCNCHKSRIAGFVPMLIMVEITTLKQSIPKPNRPLGLQEQECHLF